MTSYIKTPKTLIDIDVSIISINAKYIYMLLLDRYNLSKQNKWIDADGNIFLYFTLFDVQKAIGTSEKTAINVMHELENNGLIIRKRQGQGNPARIYLPNPELEGLEIKECQKDTSETKPKAEKCQNNVSEKKQEKEENKENKEISKVTDTFKRFFGREPDKSFKKTIQKRIKENNLKIETIKAAIEKAFQVKAKKPEAFVLYLTQFNQNIEQENIQEQNQNSEADKPLEEWEVEWLLEIMEDDKNNGKPYSQEKIDEYKKLLDEFSKQRIEKQVTDMLDNSWI